MNTTKHRSSEVLCASGINPTIAMSALEAQLFSTRNLSRFRALSWTRDELMLGVRGRADMVIVTARDSKVVICFAATLRWIADEVLQVLRDVGIHPMPTSVEAHSLNRKFIRHDHMRGGDKIRPRHYENREQTRQKRALETLENALEQAEAMAGKWLLITETARRSAASYRFTRPEEVTRALLELAKAAELNAAGGLGDSWRNHLRVRGVNYTPHSSPTAITMYSEQYHVTVNGKRLLAEAHVVLGTSSAPHCARIYVRQPDSPGNPVIVGSVGPHLDTSTR